MRRKMAPNVADFFLNNNLDEASSNNISYWINSFLESQGVGHLNVHGYRHWFETEAQNQLEMARIRNVGLREAESTRELLCESLGHSEAVSQQYYVHPSAKQAEARSTHIDRLCTRAETRTDKESDHLLKNFISDVVDREGVVASDHFGDSNDVDKTGDIQTIVDGKVFSKS